MTKLIVSSLSFPVVLRAWETKDVDSLVANANNKKIWDNVRDTFPYPYALQDAEAWIQTANVHTDPLCNFAIEVEGQAVGNVSITPKHHEFRKNVEIGYWLGEKYWYRGIMTAVLGEIVPYCWANFDIVRIFASIYAFNIGSARILKKVGFVEEARLKNGLIKNGEITDEIIFSLLRK